MATLVDVVEPCFYIALLLMLVLYVKRDDMDRTKELKAKPLYCNPRGYVQELHVPRLLDRSLNSSIIISLEFKREAARPGDVPMYRDLSMRLYYGAGKGPVANSIIPHFRMGDRRSVRYTVVVDASRLPWEDAFDKISGGSTVLLRLVLLGKFKVQERRDHDFYYSDCSICACEWSEFEAEAEVLVDASAHMISNPSDSRYH